MWWNIGWDGWVFGAGGLITGLAGLAVGIRAWANAAGAKKAAKEVADELDTFESRLSEKLEQERTLRSTRPVVVEPVNFLPGKNADGFVLQNFGPGDAYNVRIEPADGSASIIGIDRWSEIPAKAVVPLHIKSNSIFAETIEINVFWEQDATGQIESRTVTYPGPNPGNF